MSKHDAANGSAENDPALSLYRADLDDLLAFFARPNLTIAQAEELLSHVNEERRRCAASELVERLLVWLEAESACDRRSPAEGTRPVSPPPLFRGVWPSNASPRPEGPASAATAAEEAPAANQSLADSAAEVGGGAMMHDVALVLLTYLGDRTIVPRLRDLVRDAPASDAFKLKLISVIHDLEPEQDSQSLLDYLRYPGKAMLQSHRKHLQRLTSPLERSFWMELMVEDMSTDARISFARSSAAVDEPAAVPVLVCMCYDPEPDVALAAMDAVERYKDARALPALHELARHHPRLRMREEAQKAADRLSVRVQLSRPHVPCGGPPTGTRAPVEPLVAAYLTTVDGRGEQAAVFVRRVRHRAPEETLLPAPGPADGDFVRLVQVAFGDQTGIEQCFGLDLHVSDLEEVLGELGAQGLAPVRVAYERALDQLSLACRWTWAAGALPPLSYVAWREWIYGPRAWQDEGPTGSPAHTGSPRPVWAGEPVWAGDATGPILARPQLSDAERRQLYETCYELLYQDEFQDWGWKTPEIDGLVEAYRECVREQGEPLENETLRALLRSGAEQLVDPDLRPRLAARLVRVAPLLRELYGEDVVWQWAVVAADALLDEAPDAQHPFLLGLVGHSLGQALDQDLDWTVAVSRHFTP